MAKDAKLNCGIIIPNLGFGTYSFGNDRDTTELAIQMALKMGYMHFDTAKIYGSEPAVGTALREVILDGRVERSDIFVTSKLWGSDHHDPVSAVSTQANSKVIIFVGSCNAIPWEHNIYPVLLHEASTFSCCRNLEMEYVDVYLVHWPVKLKPWVACAIPKEDEFEPLDLETTGSPEIARCNLALWCVHSTAIGVPRITLTAGESTLNRKAFTATSTEIYRTITRALREDRGTNEPQGISNMEEDVG
ncbi:hypothetical protein RJ640_013451 [Escallonia rubra]|uniref:NADP-dependent oxidoreductase domain-containing protein n=1 Tax=Escallonia rubra TaxID=112253 RepID=A0AA88RBL2_9ASTE|nr:hypothetical protein RJ640_013451 [Escallonia rubra]